MQIKFLKWRVIDITLDFYMELPSYSKCNVRLLFIFFHTYMVTVNCWQSQWFITLKVQYNFIIQSVCHFLGQFKQTLSTIDECDNNVSIDLGLQLIEIDGSEVLEENAQVSWYIVSQCCFFIFLLDIQQDLVWCVLQEDHSLLIIYFVFQFAF